MCLGIGLKFKTTSNQNLKVASLQKKIPKKNVIQTRTIIDMIAIQFNMSLHNI